MNDAESCAGCGFDGTAYDVRDALGTLRAIVPMWHQLTDGAPASVLATRPALGVWSAAEYAAHSADITEAMGRLLHATLTIDDLAIDLPDAERDPDASPGLPAILDRLEANLQRLGRRAGDVGGDEEPAWARTVTAGGERHDAGWILRHAVHDATHHVRDAGRGLHELGAGAPTQVGTVAHLHRSDGGVPKPAVDTVEVGPRGVVGDRQADRRNHGRPFQALCLWSTEVIDALRAEGHPIGPGLAGENITVSGIDWTTVRTGVRLRLGEVLAEVSVFALPCAKNAAWFVDRDFRRMEHERHPGWSRAYAWVLEPGTIRVGDAAVVEG